ncbi:tRNA-aminoacylation cofactor arc1 [Neolecta irregularis DAH-3]|uniref:tRNA-aminoacylation cofactor arc1 n=1 Tax=Neolecta irregularis (strain DAH-3) TaxID=1198029 RepID=A0A1U7LU80_NEOID|nr:tRNA-aminoacylation cofactor arc1 [Neolecta irregularis DAH-3]|eukprot:OLL26235.1 tRNA-aminoacylation cofactor arc1 [Neolecta irregularis DAH-3]
MTKLTKLNIAGNDITTSLVAKIFPNPSIEIISSPETRISNLTFADNSTLTGQNTICTYIASSDCGDTDLEKAEVQQWLTLSNRFESDPEGLKLLQSHLETRTWMIGNKMSLTDVTVYVRMIPIVKSWRGEDRLNNNHIVRWFDFIQHQAEICENDLAKQLEKIQIDLNAAKGKKKQDLQKTKVRSTVNNQELQPSKMEATEQQADVGKSGGAKKEKKQKEKKSKEPAKTQELIITPGMIDLRVGHIVKVEKHPDADSLYVETIDVGEAELRTVVSGLVKHIPIEQMQGRKVVLVCNLKPAAMRGVKSYAMVLCASNSDGKVEVIDPPASSKLGDRAVFEGFEDEIPEPVLNPKKKIWETIQPDFTSTDSRAVAWKDSEGKMKLLLVNGERCHAQSLVGADIK